MHERIRKLRKTLELTQQEFGKRIGMKRNSIALIEGGRNTSEQTIFAICREFNVNEEWLRTGNGKMFNLVPEEDLYSKAAASILKDNDALAIEALKLYFELSPEAKKSVTDYILQLSDMIRKYNTKVQYLWAKFINAERKEEFDMLAEKNVYIESAYEQLQVISQDRQKRLEYEAREKAILDYNQGMFEAEQRGMQRGKQEGIQQGRQEGIYAIISGGLEDGLSEERILSRLQQYFSLTKEQAMQYYHQFTKK